MGSTTSKPARKLAHNATHPLRSPSQAASALGAPPTHPVHPPIPSQLTPPPHGSDTYEAPSPPGPTPATLASESKTQDIVRDASDPQLLKNLARLGAVKIRKQATNYEPSDQMLHILAARQKASLEACDSFAGSAATPASSGGRLGASTLSQLLDERKACTSLRDLERLAVEYDVPLRRIEELAQRFNPPTVGDEIYAENVGERDETAQIKYKAVWVEAKLGSKVPRVE
ncbi:hypothetical protein ACQY0O_007843 [Thecaphora frezii]